MCGWAYTSAIFTRSPLQGREGTLSVCVRVRVYACVYYVLVHVRVLFAYVAYLWLAICRKNTRMHLPTCKRAGARAHTHIHTHM